MFDIGFLELLLVAIAALVFVRAEDWPKMLRFCGRAAGECRKIWREITSEIQQISKETSSTITGLDGKNYIAYDVSELEDLLGEKPKNPQESAQYEAGRAPAPAPALDPTPVSAQTPTAATPSEKAPS